MRRFQYFAPHTLDEALSFLKGNGAKVLAGGTDLLVQMKEAGLHPGSVVSLHQLDELRGIEFSETDGLRIGSGTLTADIAAHPVVLERYTALADGAGIIGSVQTRNLATLGGNICNAAPSADTAPPLVVFDAVAEAIGTNGRRDVPIEQLWAGPGKTTLAPDEIVTSFRLPTPRTRTGSVYQRHTPRKIMDIAVVSVGIRLTLADNGAIGEARVCLGAVAPTVIRAPEAEQALTGQAPRDDLFDQAAALAQQAAKPISDVRGSAEFRSYLVGAMTKRCLSIALDRAKAG